jgi:hypothetical protein
MKTLIDEINKIKRAINAACRSTISRPLSSGEVDAA